MRRTRWLLVLLKHNIVIIIYFSQNMNLKQNFFSSGVNVPIRIEPECWFKKLQKKNALVFSWRCFFGYKLSYLFCSRCFQPLQRTEILPTCKNCVIPGAMAFSTLRMRLTWCNKTGYCLSLAVLVSVQTHLPHQVVQFRFRGRYLTRISPKISHIFRRYYYQEMTLWSAGDCNALLTNYANGFVNESVTPEKITLFPGTEPDLTEAPKILKRWGLIHFFMFKELREIFILTWASAAKAQIKRLNVFQHRTLRITFVVA